MTKLFFKPLHLITALLFMLVSVNVAKAQSVTIDGITYTKSTNTACVSSASDSLIHAEILPNVTINGYAYPVTGIGYGAFGMQWNDGSRTKLLETVSIPNSVTEIGDYAFSYCTSLDSIALPTSLTSIGRGAFQSTSIRSMELPASLKEIGYNAFSHTTIRLTCNSSTPPTLKPSSEGSAPTLGNIVIVYVPAGCGPAYRSVDPWPNGGRTIIDGSGIAVAVTVTPGMMGEEILNKTNALRDVNYLTLRGSINDADISHIQNSMPNLLTIDMSGLDMKQIPVGMFYDRKALLSVILPNNVETIGNRAFYNCINIETMVLPEGLKTIEGDYQSSDYNGGNTLYNGAFRNCTSLKSISFPSTLQRIGARAFQYCNALTKVVLNDGLETMEHYAFSNCNRLADVTLPNGLSTIEYGAFCSCHSLTEITLPKGLKRIGDDYESEGAFEYCSSLTSISLPDGLEHIGQYSFRGCHKLTEIEVPEGVTRIDRQAFQGCTGLTSASLPSTLTRCGTAPFSGCNKLASVKCLALLPPSLADGLLTLDDMGLAIQRTLSVPEWTLNRYKLASGWAAFSNIQPISGIYPSSINVINETVLTLPTTGLPANYKPNMTISSNYIPGVGSSTGSLHLRGTGNLSLNKFEMGGYDGMSEMGMYYGDPQLLNEEATMSADSILIMKPLQATYYDNNTYQSRQMWHFLSFPFDVKLSDVVTNCDWVVRKYDGEARAKAEYNNTWVTVPYDSILHAGQGYIWSCSGGQFTIPALDNANKNLIFANTTRTIPLKEYVSDITSNNSWNLVGNPFPCHYDISKMDYTAPITVWDKNNNTYAAYSPVDDNYVLSPFEAFFVQCPANVSGIGFDESGRQLSAQPDTTSAVSAAARALARFSQAERSVMNLVLSNEHYSDRTRIVINNKAKMGYELECDAAKFMSNDANMSQFYSVNGEEKYAINERPMDNGIVKLGARFATDGEYTISLKGESDMVVILVDTQTGVETDLTTGDYSFTAEAGDSDRFEARLFNNDNATSVEGIEARPEISVAGNEIVVAMANDANVKLYNVAGALIASAQGNNLTFSVAPGMYVVSVNGTSYKVAVGK